MYTLAYKKLTINPIPSDVTHLRVTAASGNVHPGLLTTYTSYNGGTEWIRDNDPMAEILIYKNDNVYTLEWGWTGGRYKYVGDNPWENPWLAELDDEDDPQMPIAGTSINVVPYIPE